jgi:hypothetical protein
MADPNGQAVYWDASAVLSVLIADVHSARATATARSAGDGSPSNQIGRRSRNLRLGGRSVEQICGTLEPRKPCAANCPS